MNIASAIVNPTVHMPKLISAVSKGGKSGFRDVRDDEIEVSTGTMMVMILILLALMALAVYMAMPCPDPVVNIIVALAFPLQYIIGRTLCPCGRKRK